MKYTLYCDYGRFGTPGRHYLRIGSWIVPPGKLVLQHGVMTWAEYRYITTLGYCPVYGSDSMHIIRIYQDADDRGTTKYRRGDKYKSCGILHRRDKDRYAGTVRLFEGGF